MQSWVLPLQPCLAWAGGVWNLQLFGCKPLLPAWDGAIVGSAPSPPIAEPPGAAPEHSLADGGRWWDGGPGAAPTAELGAPWPRSLCTACSSALMGAVLTSCRLVSAGDAPIITV